MPTIVSSPIPYPASSGARQSWASIKAIVAGAAIPGIKKISYDRTRTREQPYGTHPNPLGKTVGENKFTCLIDFYLAEMHQIRAALVAEADKTGIGYGDVFFDIQVQYTANGFDTIQDVIKGCTLDVEKAENSQGPAALIRNVELNPIEIVFENNPDYLPGLQAPPS